MPHSISGLGPAGGGSRRRALGLHDFAAAQARRAHADALTLAVDLGVHRAQVDVPPPLGHVVGVADAVSRLRLLAANITLLCHDSPERFRSCGAMFDFTGISADSAILDRDRQCPNLPFFTTESRRKTRTC